MSHSSRRALFYVLLLVFLMFGTGIILFAQGWRMDFPSFRVSKVGGIYVRSYPDDANIFLNGKPVANQSGLLSRGTLISNLFPKNYRLALTAPGYVDWHENVTVSPSMVANHDHAVLVPANATSVVTGPVADFRESQGNIVLETAGGEITFNGKAIGFGKLIAASPDLASIIFQTAKGTYEFADTETGAITNLSDILADTGFTMAAPTDVTLDLSLGTTVLAANAKKVDMLDIAQGTTTEISAAPRGQTIATGIAVSPSTIAWAGSTGSANSSSLLFYDLSLQDVTRTTVATGGSVKELYWITGSLLGVLTDNGSFYLYDTVKQNFQKMADEVRSVSATADGSRIAALETDSLEIFILNEKGYYRFNLPDINNAQASFWYHDDDHLFVAYADHVSFLDLEDASLANFTTVSSGTAASYDPQVNGLFIIDPQGRLLRFNFAK